MLADYETIEVTKIPPEIRREVLIERIMKLLPAQGKVLRVDHDPKPLYELLTEHHGLDLDWRYIENGPIWWEVLVIMKSGVEEMVLDDFIGNNLSRMLFFAKYEPEICINRSMSLGQFCDKFDLDVPKVYAQASQINNFAQPHFDYWKLSLFVEFIIENYHRYERKLVNDTKEILDKVNKAHGDELKFLPSLVTHYNALMVTLFDHFQEEETYFFDLLQIQGSQKDLESSYQHVEHDHDLTLNELIIIKKITSNFTPPDTGCALTKQLFINLEELHNDLLCHTFIEEKFLGPMVSG
jgi:regulator of cell morphogenesis and NO signaling